MKGIMKIVKSLKDSCLLLKGVSETIQNKAIEQKGEFLSMLLGTLGATLLGNMLAGKGIKKAGLFKNFNLRIFDLKKKKEL